MQAYRLETIVPPNGELHLQLPSFRPGEMVEVIILPLNRLQNQVNHFPLKNTVLKYEDPTEPVAEMDGEVLQ